jgi:hypothetical protein
METCSHVTEYGSVADGELGVDSDNQPRPLIREVRPCDAKVASRPLSRRDGRASISRSRGWSLFVSLAVMMS